MELRKGRIMTKNSNLEEKMQAQNSTVDAQEIEKFARISESWWDLDGPFKPLHALNPARLTYIRDQLCAHFMKDTRSLKPLKGLKILDIGCGGGLLCEPLSRMGADITGVDAAEENIAVASYHRDQMGLTIDYRHDTAENLVAQGEKFDAIINMEVIEHVADVRSFLKACHDLLNDEGVMLVSTLNRTLRSFMMAIVGAEYILRWLPQGTHDWQKFLTPEEFAEALNDAGFKNTAFEGLSFNLLERDWAIKSGETAVNYVGRTIKND